MTARRKKQGDTLQASELNWPVLCSGLSRAEGRGKSIDLQQLYF